MAEYPVETPDVPEGYRYIPPPPGGGAIEIPDGQGGMRSLPPPPDGGGWLVPDIAPQEDTTRLPEGEPSITPARPLGPGVSPIQEKVRQLKESQAQAEKDTARLREVQAENRRRRLLEIRQRLGDEPFDDAGAMAGDLSELALRADFRRSDKFSEVYRKFYFSDLGTQGGELKLLKLSDNEEVLLFKEKKDAAWKPVDNDSVELLGDLVDILPDVFSVAGISNALATFMTGGSGTTARVLGPAIGEAIGTIGDYLVEKSRGLEDTGAVETGVEAAQRGALNAILGRLLLFRDKLAQKYPEVSESSRMAQFAKTEDLDPIMRGQAASSPITRAAFIQAGTTIRSIEEKIQGQKEKLLAAVRRRAPEDMEIDAALEEAAEKSMERVRGSIEGLKTGSTKLDSTQAIENIVVNFVEAQGRRVGKAYDAALALADNVTYDVAPAQELASIVLRGVRAEAKEGEPVRAAGKLSAEFKEALDDLLRMTARVGANRPDTPFDVIKNLRTRFYLLAQPTPGTRRSAEEKQANDIYRALTEVMDNPIGGDTQQFKRMYQRASTMNREFENDIGAAYIKAVLREKDQAGNAATALAKSVASPGRPRQLRLVRKMATKEEWETFRDGYKQTLIEDPKSIIRALDSWNLNREQRSLRLLLSPSEESALRQYAKDWTAFEKSALKGAVDADALPIEKAGQLIAKASRKELADMVANTGGKNGPLARNLVGATYERILNKAIRREVPSGREVLDPRTALAEMEKIVQEKKVFSYMTPKELENFDNFVVYAAMLSGKAGAGADLRKAAQAAKAKKFTQPIQVYSAHREIMHDRVIGRILSQPAGQRLIESGSGMRLEPGTAKTIRLLGMVLGGAAIRAEKQRDLSTIPTPEEVGGMQQRRDEIMRQTQ